MQNFQILTKTHKKRYNAAIELKKKKKKRGPKSASNIIIVKTNSQHVSKSTFSVQSPYLGFPLWYYTERGVSFGSRFIGHTHILYTYRYVTIKPFILGYPQKCAWTFACEFSWKDISLYGSLSSLILVHLFLWVVIIELYFYGFNLIVLFLL